MKITSFSFSHGGMHRFSIYSFSVEKTAEGAMLTISPSGGSKPGKNIPIAPSVLDSLAKLVKTYNIADWDGYDKSNKEILDGSIFSIEITFADGKTITARGSNSFPPTYHAARNKINTIFEYLTKTYYVGWAGEYTFSEAHEQVFFNYKLIIEKSKDLAVRNEHRRYEGKLCIDGFNTSSRMQVEITEDWSNVEIVFVKYLPDNIVEHFNKGELMLRLKTCEDNIFTQWAALKPHIGFSTKKNTEQWLTCFSEV